MKELFWMGLLALWLVNFVLSYSAKNWGGVAACSFCVYMSALVIFKVLVWNEKLPKKFPKLRKN